MIQLCSEERKRADSGVPRKVSPSHTRKHAYNIPFDHTAVKPCEVTRATKHPSNIVFCGPWIDAKKCWRGYPCRASR